MPFFGSNDKPMDLREFDNDFTSYWPEYCKETKGNNDGQEQDSDQQ